MLKAEEEALMMMMMVWEKRVWEEGKEEVFMLQGSISLLVLITALIQIGICRIIWNQFKSGRRKFSLEDPGCQIEILITLNHFESCQRVLIWWLKRASNFARQSWPSPLQLFFQGRAGKEAIQILPSGQHRLGC